ncbi:MAG: hypothetical protein JW821_07165 [Deltaproteobacteria bacterium]|nr:hypothetical protein [Deltaproteobacteria bacterium]
MEKRFGIIAVEKGFVAPAQVLEAMGIQIKENMQNQTHRSLGEILVEKGYMTRPQINEVLKSMDIPI